MQQPPDGNEEQTSSVSFVALVFCHSSKFLLLLAELTGLNTNLFSCSLLGQSAWRLYLYYPSNHSFCFYTKICEREYSLRNAQMLILLFSTKMFLL